MKIKYVTEDCIKWCELERKDKRFIKYPVVPVVLLSDFERVKQRYFDVRERKLFFLNTDGSMQEVFDMWFFECFGVEK